MLRFNVLQSTLVVPAVVAVVGVVVVVVVVVVVFSGDITATINK
jgi:hypothetical protein